METDLTLLYYSSNVLDERVTNNLRNELLKTTQGKYPIISVTQKQINLGENVCIGNIGQSYYNMYKQIFAGALKVKTKYVALVEDDSLYNMEHFSHRPMYDDVFSYNKNIWFLDKNIFWTKDHIGGFTTIVSTKLLIETHSQIFEKYPVEPLPREKQKHLLLEPGIRDEQLGFRKQKIEYFSTKNPLITLCYWGATAGWPRRRERNSTTAEYLENWGDAKELRTKLFQ